MSVRIVLLNDIYISLWFKVSNTHIHKYMSILDIVCLIHLRDKVEKRLFRQFPFSCFIFRFFFIIVIVVGVVFAYIAHNHTTPVVICFVWF